MACLPSRHPGCCWSTTTAACANVLDVYIRYLRQKLERPGRPTLVQTVRGVGFMLKAGDPKR